jgi:hypothetical protein
MVLGILLAGSVGYVASSILRGGGPNTPRSLTDEQLEQEIKSLETIMNNGIPDGAERQQMINHVTKEMQALVAERDRRKRERDLIEEIQSKLFLLDEPPEGRDPIEQQNYRETLQAEITNAQAELAISQNTAPSAAAPAANTTVSSQRERDLIEEIQSKTFLLNEPLEGDPIEQQNYRETLQAEIRNAQAELNLLRNTAPTPPAPAANDYVPPQRARDLMEKIRNKRFHITQHMPGLSDAEIQSYRETIQEEIRRAQEELDSLTRGISLGSQNVFIYDLGFNSALMAPAARRQFTPPDEKYAVNGQVYRLAAYIMHGTQTDYSKGPDSAGNLSGGHYIAVINTPQGKYVADGTQVIPLAEYQMFFNFYPTMTFYETPVDFPGEIPLHGLRVDLGNTCYGESAIQAIAACKVFWKNLGNCSPQMRNILTNYESNNINRDFLVSLGLERPGEQDDPNVLVRPIVQRIIEDCGGLIAGIETLNDYSQFEDRIPVYEVEAMRRNENDGCIIS